MSFSPSETVTLRGASTGVIEIISARSRCGLEENMRTKAEGAPVTETVS